MVPWFQAKPSSSLVPSKPSSKLILQISTYLPKIRIFLDKTDLLLLERGREGEGGRGREGGREGGRKGGQTCSEKALRDEARSFSAALLRLSSSASRACRHSRDHVKHNNGDLTIHTYIHIHIHIHTYIYIHIHIHNIYIGKQTRML
jgi:hypothetical protein